MSWSEADWAGGLVAAMFGVIVLTFGVRGVSRARRTGGTPAFGTSMHSTRSMLLGGVVLLVLAGEDVLRPVFGYPVLVPGVVIVLFLIAFGVREEIRARAVEKPARAAKPASPGMPDL